jgi:endoglucanase
MLTETGGGNTQSCQKYLCEELQFLKYVPMSST